MKKILVIEDETVLRQAYKAILTQEGYQVEEAADGEEGLAKLGKVKPDIILLDIVMPKIDGLEFLNRANLAKDYPHTQVLAFSNLSDQQKLMKMMALGATRHVLKASVSPKQLVDTVTEMLSN